MLNYALVSLVLIDNMILGFDFLSYRNKSVLMESEHRHLRSNCFEKMVYVILFDLGDIGPHGD